MDSYKKIIVLYEYLYLIVGITTFIQFATYQYYYLNCVVLRNCISCKLIKLFYFFIGCEVCGTNAMLYW